MVKHNLTVTPLTNSDWQHSWGAVSRLNVAHKPLVSEAVTIVASSRGRTEPSPSAFETRQTLRLNRTIAVWILVGALWISIGMIVSATVVTVAFLA